MHIHTSGRGGSLAAATSNKGAAAGSKKPDPKGDGKAAGLASPEAQPLLLALFTAASEDIPKASESLAAYINSRGIRVLDTEGIAASLVTASQSKKVALEREAAAAAFQTIAYQCAGKNAAPFALGAEPWLMDLLPPTLDLYADKSDTVREAAEGAASALVSLIPPEGVPDLLPRLYAILKDGSIKWQTKVGTLKILTRLSEADSEQIGEVLEDLIPVLTHAMHESKAEVSIPSPISRRQWDAADFVLRTDFQASCQDGD